MAVPVLLEASHIVPNLRHGDPGPLATHAWHELIHLERGSYRAELVGDVASLQPGELIVLPAGVRHRGVLSRDGMTAYHLLRWEGDCPAPSAQRLVDADGRLAMALDWLCERSQTAESRPSTILLRGLLQALLAELALRLNAPAAVDAIDRAREFIDAHLHFSSLDLAQLAARVGLGRSRFSEQFTARVGVPPMRYLRQQRLATARRLRAAGRLEPAEIARRVGISNPGYLARLLRQSR